MPTTIKTLGVATASFTIGCGPAGKTAKYQVQMEGSQTVDIGDEFDVPETWKCRAVWYHATDRIKNLNVFAGIKLTPRAGDIDLTLHGSNDDGNVEITVTAIYEAAV
ncbi:MAG: hypothetical protein QOG23_4452 [Blastocatellia bacterium]|jgi:hypothetical protein|nr:hypothetical protein [Blastocatellia bacterium]